MLTLPSAVRIFVCTQPTDMRCGFNKLSMYAGSLMGQDPLSGHLFVYFNRRGDKCKILFWDRSGFCLWYKRLERGTFPRLESTSQGICREIDLSRLSLILEGVEVSQVKRRKWYRRA